MSNNRNLGNIANAITNATSGQVLTSQGSGVATFVDAGGGVTYYANVSDLPASGNSNGDAAFVGANNRLYIFNGAGWYSVALLNQTPTFPTNSIQDAGGGSTPFTLSTDGTTATIITVNATDAEGQALTYNYSVDGSLNGSTISQNNNVFTVLPHASNSTAFDLTFTASDGINTATSAAQSFTLSFAPDWSGASQQAQIQHSNADGYDSFGFSVDISNDGNTAIVGANAQDTGGTNAGSAYIFTRSGTSWSQQAQIQGSDTSQHDGFGNSVSISSDGDTAIVGANLEDTGGTSAGSAYIFTRSGSTWSQQAKIQASDTQSGDNFGVSVSISSDGNTVVVGARTEGTGGSAYIFTVSGTSWSQQAKIQASDAQSSDNFGVSVSISSDGSSVIVGANTEDTTATDAGSAYIFTRSGTSWSQQAKIQASDAEGGDHFGFSVSMSDNGNYVIVGSPQEGSVAYFAGASYIFTRSGTSWSQQAKIVGSDTSGGNRFGYSVGISNDGDFVISGALYANTGGSAYVFSRSGTSWTQESKVEASNAGSGDFFGSSVAINGSTAIVGAYDEDTTSDSSGSAYIFVSA